MRIADLWWVCVDAVSARPVRSVLTMIGTILGTASFVAIIGLTTTASGQITESFNALQATQVMVYDKEAETSGGYHFPSSSGEILRGLNGVVDAGVFYKATVGSEAAQVTIATRPQIDLGSDRAGIGLVVYGAEPGTFAAAETTLLSGRGLDEVDVAQTWPVAVLGPSAAQQLGIATVATRPTVFVGDTAYTVVGILSGTGALPELGNAVILPAPVALRDFGPPERTSPAKLIIRTAMGAAGLISVQAPLALSPNDPAYLVASEPPDWSKITDPVNTSMNALLFGLAGIALVIGCVAIANTTLAAVMERTGEIGLRQAIGARRIHIAAQFIVEAGITGGLGGLIGSAAGAVSIISVAAARRWTPYVDWRLLVVAPAAGALIGILAGLYPAWKAANVAPVRALQHL